MIFLSFTIIDIDYKSSTFSANAMLYTNVRKIIQKQTMDFGINMYSFRNLVA